MRFFVPSQATPSGHDQFFGTFARCRDLLRQDPVQADSRTDGATNDLTDRTADLTTGARPFPGALRGGRLCKRCT